LLKMLLYLLQAPGSDIFRCRFFHVLQR
jgi:hypothetical protein